MDKIIQKPSPNFTSRNGYKPELLVVHVMAGSLLGTDQWFTNPKSQVSSHYGIGKNGEIHQYVQEQHSAWTQGNVRKPSAKLKKNWLGMYINPNYYSISFENEGYDLSIAPETQLNALCQLLYKTAIKYNIPIDRQHIIGHYEIDSVVKINCPSPKHSMMDKIVTKVGNYNPNRNNKMQTAYKFTNKETGEVKFGLLREAGQGTDTFRTVDGLDIVVNNVEMDGSNLTNDTYTVEKVEDYTGELPTWS